MNDMNNQTDIFGNVTPFDTEEVKDQPVINSNSSDSSLENTSDFIFPEDTFVSHVEIPTNEPVSPTSVVEPVSPDIKVEEASSTPQNESFNEMPFVGVNKQTLSSDTLNTQSTIDYDSVQNSNMHPIEKAEDENSGLKFLIVLGIIFAVVIILLPYFL